MDSAQGPAGVQSEIAPIFEDLSQSKKLSEIKPPLPLLPNNFMTSNINFYLLRQYQNSGPCTQVLTSLLSLHLDIFSFGYLDF